MQTKHSRLLHFCFSFHFSQIATTEFFIKKRKQQPILLLHSPFIFFNKAKIVAPEFLSSTIVGHCIFFKKKNSAALFLSFSPTHSTELFICSSRRKRNYSHFFRTLKTSRLILHHPHLNQFINLGN